MGNTKISPRQRGKKRLAIKVDDHALSYINFHGVIPEGHYVAGKVKIWDKGTFKTIERTANKIIFELKGRKIKGIYCLIKFKTKNKNTWLFFKR